MIDGTYEVYAKTPLGKKSGKLVLSTDQNVCNAELSVAGKTKHLVGTINGDMVTFEGKVKLPFPAGEVNYSLEGTVEGDELKGVCRYKKKSFEVWGTRCA